MKTLRSISTAVLLCLVLAAPAAATTTPNVSVTLSATSVTLGTSPTYRVSGEGEARQTFAVRVMSLASYPASECFRSNERSQSVFEFKGQLGGAGTELHEFSESGEISNTDDNALGSYVVCARIQEGIHPAESEPVTFTVIAPVSTSASTPSVINQTTIPAPPLLPVVSKPTVKVPEPGASSKKCKRLKNHKKRIQCERKTQRRGR
jgi:hypothetical protein